MSALLEPVPFGNTRFEVQRDTKPGAVKVAVFDSLDEAKEYVRRSNAYPKLVEALRKVLSRDRRQIVEGKVAAAALLAVGESIEVCPECAGEIGVQRLSPEQSPAGCDTSVEYCIECGWRGEPE